MIKALNVLNDIIKSSRDYQTREDLEKWKKTYISIASVKYELSPEALYYDKGKINSYYKSLVGSRLGEDLIKNIEDKITIDDFGNEIHTFTIAVLKDVNK